MKYRKEIDGLRALAVLSVILFHAEFAAFRGGFVGVDIFFVISGYLITATIIDEIQRNIFSIKSFYERRARRILPALYFVMLCTLPFAFFMMLPSALRSFSKSLIAVPLFTSNILFSFNSYFDVESQINPLLHTWTLAVEEQYYALAPVLMLLAWKLGKKKIIIIGLMLALTSLIISQLLNYSVFAYYSLITRSFEIIIGALISLLISYRPKISYINSSYGEILTVASMILILISINKFDANTPYPSLYTLIPTISTAVIILFSNNNNIVGVILANRFLTPIGLISYSTYLWHQPLFAFVRIMDVNLQEIFFAPFSLILGFFTWQFVEKPFRNYKKISTIKFVLLSSLFSIMFIAIGFISLKFNFIDNSTLIQKEIISYDNYDYSKILRRGTCFIEQNQTYVEFTSDCFDRPNSDSYLIWGDSYAAASSFGMRKVHKNSHN